jgi:Zn-dependent peptidase ImmA (M78 family)
MWSLEMPKRVTIPVNPRIWEWAKQQIPPGPHAQELKERISGWLTGNHSPTFHQLVIFSKAVQIPFGYFFLKNPPTETLPLLRFRTVRNAGHEQPSRNLLETVYQMESIQTWMHQYRKEEGWDTLPVVGCVSSSLGVDAIVTRMRRDLDLSETWFTQGRDPSALFKLVRQKLGTCGVLVMMNGCVGSNTHRPLDLGEFRAFALRDHLGPVIFINAKDSASGRLFSLVHEAVHIWLGKSDLFNVTIAMGEEGRNIQETERICNAVTGELLVPQTLFLARWEAAVFSDEMARIDWLAEHVFHVGPIIIARKALDHQLVSQDVYDVIVERQIQRYQEAQTKHPGSYYPTIRSRLDPSVILALDASVQEGRTTYMEAVRLSGASLKTYDRVVQMMKKGRYA